MVIFTVDFATIFCFFDVLIPSSYCVIMITFCTTKIKHLKLVQPFEPCAVFAKDKISDELFFTRHDSKKIRE